MKSLAGVVGLLVVFLLTGPAFAQPFADTPTNHWAYDAIAELAAKGLIEGYPDGTFKGDRAMTRYEMAMVVARLLARIESIQIPTPAPPPKPEVTKADIDMILRLVNEFRAELAAKNVRLTAVEEELNAIKATLSNVRITGGVRFRYDLNQFAVNGPGGPLPGNNNPNTGATDAANTPRGNRPRYAAKLGFDGTVTPDVHFILAFETAGGFQFFNSSNFGFGAGVNGQPQQGAFGSIDNAFFDWRNAFGWPLEIWLGRFGGGAAGGATAIGKTYPVQFGPFGLLLNTLTDQWTDTTADSGANVVDGARVALNLASLADLQFQAVWVRVTGNIGSFSFPSGEDMYGGDVNVQVFPGLRIGGYYVANTIGNFGSTPFPGPSPLGTLFHLYGPAGGSVNPATARCPASATGINCPAAGNGWGAYVQWGAVPGVHLDIEAAQWNDTTPGGGSDSGFNAVATFDLATLLNLRTRLVVTAGYQYSGVNFYPPYGNVSLDSCCWDFLYPGNAQGFTGTVTWGFAPGWSLYGDYVTGNHVSNSQNIQEYEVGIKYGFAPNASVLVKYRDLRIAGVDQNNVLRAQLDYTF